MDSSYIHITNVTAATTSAAFDVFGESKLIASGLAGDEYAVLMEEGPDGVYRPVINNSGLSVQVTVKQPSQVFVGYGSYKVYKTLTASAASVAVVA